MDAMDHSIQEIPASKVKCGASLGGGGQGDVYEGVWEREKVAIKIMQKMAADSPHTKRCLQEMLVLTRLRHPNIVSVFGISRQADGSVWLIMELVEGGTLNDLVERAGGPLPLAEALHYLLALASALAHTHSKKLAHNDVKGKNVLVTKTTAKLADFGFVAILGSGSKTFDFVDQAATDGGILGTINCTAPENYSSSLKGFGEVSQSKHVPRRIF